jgi:hypothetical protein
MARREVTMNEIVEIIYQWHQGAGFKEIHRSLGFHRKTIRKYVELGQAAGISRGTPFPEESELVAKLNSLTDSPLLRETPVQDLLSPHQEWFKQLLKSENMTAKQVWRLFREQTESTASYSTVKRYLRARFQFGAPRNTVRMEVLPGSGLRLCGPDDRTGNGPGSEDLGLYHDPFFQPSSVCPLCLSSGCGQLD